MNLFNRLLRNLINLILSLGAACLCVILTLLMVIANYLACEVSFELLGYDKKPLYADHLVGPFFSAFFPKAALTHLYAFVVAAVVSLGLFLSFRIISHIFELFKERRHYLDAGDQDSVRIIKQLMLWDLIELAALAIPLSAAVYWDVQLFRFRSICGAGAIEDPEVATTLSNWELQLQDNGALWAWAMTNIGAWGYIGITALSCLALEYVLRKTSEHWAKLLNSVDEIFSSGASPEEQPPFYGYDENGQPVYAPDIPVSYDVNGNALFEPRPETAGVEHPATGEVEPDQRAATGGSPASAGTGFGSANSPGAATANVHSGAGPSEPGIAPGASAADDFRSPGTERITLHEVIGSPDGERVSLAEALSRPERYWVDPESHEVWDITYRRLLFGEAMQQAA